MSGRKSLFLARRLHGFALIADGFGIFFGVRFGLSMRTARRIGRINGRATLEAAQET